MHTLLELCKSSKYRTDKYICPDRTDLFWNKYIASYDGAPVPKFNSAGHCYVEYVYDKHFERIKNSASKILEIGVQGGGSLNLWKDYFTNATVFGMDITYTQNVSSEGIFQIVGNAYSESMTEILTDGSFDVIIDDGSHLLQDMVFFVKNYLSKIKPDGILVVEDISNLDWANKILFSLPEYIREYARIYDLRHVNNRWDDIIIVVDKGI